MMEYQDYMQINVSEKQYDNLKEMGGLRVEGIAKKAREVYEVACKGCEPIPAFCWISHDYGENSKSTSLLSMELYRKIKEEGRFYPTPRPRKSKKLEATGQGALYVKSVDALASTSPNDITIKI